MNPLPDIRRKSITIFSCRSINNEEMNGGLCLI